MDHRQYFEDLERLGRAAVAELRSMDTQNGPLYREYHDQLRAGKITEFGYRGLVKALDDGRTKKVAKIKADLADLKERYHKAAAAAMLPSAEQMRSADMELLKHMDLSADEFEAMTEKHRDNPTMLRVLEEYRKDHDIPTSWRYQSLTQRQEIFDSACSSVESIIGQLDKYSPDRDGNITRRVYGAYHKLQNADPDALRVPAATAQEGFTLPAGTRLI